MNHASCAADRRWSRRHLLAMTGTVVATGLGGCLDEDDTDVKPATPIALDDGETCDACGMVIADHYGPAGQLFYAVDDADADGSAQFDSLTELLAYHDHHSDQGWELRAVFVTDYSSVEYQLEDRNETTHISSHVAEETFVDATGLYYVVGSDVMGAMGEEVFPFSDRDDATAFADKYNGEVQDWETLSPTEQ
ncbi:nitrous oxide reductase accessory protein NosL [Natrialba sp. SSL1]|uniref:nitrous oxide reductase accessory protein NosL n=1 Tax=Natrialba sp. SSL1 TaxID=1869245 RepID=UPI0008F8F219|nr:nitrous oxide reductase accessory protein NosL [Natrialba sp. SSL1]OIB58979.1 nitrous oxide reductase accessory protein NosL [Natrialba sp. SSL1]